MADIYGPKEIERTRGQLSRPTFRANTPAMGLVADDLLATVDALRATLAEIAAAGDTHDETHEIDYDRYCMNCPSADGLAERARLALLPEPEAD